MDWEAFHDRLLTRVSDCRWGDARCLSRNHFNKHMIFFTPDKIDEKLSLMILLPSCEFVFFFSFSFFFSFFLNEPTTPLSSSYWFGLYGCQRQFPRDFHWRQRGSWRSFPSHVLGLIHSVLHWRVNDDGGRWIRRSSGWFGFRAAKPASLVYLAAALPWGFPRRTRGQWGPSTGQHQGGTRGRPCLQSGTRWRYAAGTEASSRRPGTHGRDAPMLGWRGGRCDRTAAQRQILSAERVG